MLKEKATVLTAALFDYLLKSKCIPFSNRSSPSFNTTSLVEKHNLT